MTVDEALQLQLDRYKQHWIDIVVDRIVVKPEVRSRLHDSVETALKAGQGIVVVQLVDGTGDEGRGTERNGARGEDGDEENRASRAFEWRVDFQRALCLPRMWHQHP